MSRGQPRAGCGTDEANKLWINLDGCGLFTAGITQGLQLFGAVVTHVRTVLWWNSNANETPCPLAGRRHQALVGRNPAWHVHFCIFYHVVFARKRFPHTRFGFLPFALELRFSCCVAAMVSDPGCVPSNAKPVDPQHHKYTCHSCNSFKPLRAHHCRICNRCVVKMDHHCETFPGDCQPRLQRSLRCTVRCTI